MYRIFFFILLLIVSLCGTSYAQRVNKWNNKKETESFTEGTYSLPVSAAIELISLHENFEKIKGGSGQELYFYTYAPKADQYLLKVQEKKIVDYYMLQSKPGKVNKGSNQIGPWRIDDFLSSLKISEENLAVALRVSADDSKYFLPINVSSGKDVNRNAQLKAVFRLSKSIRSGTYSIFKGEHKGIAPEENLVQTSKIGRAYGGGVVQINIDRKGLKDYEGWVTVSISLSPKDSMKKIPYTFYFFHSNS